jgi:hypothetical protein
MGSGGGDETLKELNLVERGLGIARCRFYDLEGYVAV